MDRIETIRTLDELGRVIIPKAFREHFGFEEGDKLKMILTDEGILIKKAIIKSWLSKHLRGAFSVFRC